MEIVAERPQGLPPFEEIAEDFVFLDDWEDRYRFLIELGRLLGEFPEAERTAQNKVQGCASQVWIATRRGKDGAGNPTVIFRGDSDALIVRGLIALLIALLSGRPARDVVVLRFAGGAEAAGARRASDPATLEWPCLNGEAPARRSGQGPIALAPSSCPAPVGPGPTTERIQPALRSRRRGWMAGSSLLPSPCVGRGGGGGAGPRLRQAVPTVVPPSALMWHSRCSTPCMSRVI